MKTISEFIQKNDKIIFLDITEEPTNSQIHKKKSDCNICPEINLPTNTLFRDHFKSNYHIHNLKRSIQCKNPISFNSFISNELELENNLSSSSEDEKEEEDNSIHAGSPMLKINIQYSSPIYIYKCTLFTKAQYESINSILPQKPLSSHSLELTNLLKENYLGIWIFFLIRSGRVATAIIDNTTGTILKHKSFKKYTTRRGQGGSQSSSDSRKSGGVSHSAGASIRRHNEKQLIEDVQALLKEYSPFVKVAKLIFWTDTQTAKSSLFPSSSISSSSSSSQHQPLLLPQDKRLRRIPISTSGNPTFAELVSCYNKLNSYTLI